MSIKNPYKKGGMFENANYLLFQNAKRLRNTLTDAEIFLWINFKETIVLELIKESIIKLTNLQNQNAPSMKGV